MATRTLQPSEYEIQREVEALRDIRRRSTTPGALTIDPDLPNQSSPPSPTTYRLGTPATVSPFLGDSLNTSLSEGSSEESGSTSGSSSLGDSSSHSNNPADDPFHLFWVPASLHPEIAPAEFRAFLKEHARSPPSSDGSTSLDRSNSSSSSSGLGRKKSMLSRQYRPAEHDGVENEHVVPLRRNRSSLYTNHGPQLTISDLQRLEELAEEASESDDPSRLRNVLRRSLSLNISPSAIDDMSDMGDEADAPIIVPPPGQILRRAARTKIRKPGLPGDGGGHRFGSSRRGGPPRSSTTPLEPRTSSDVSSSDHSDSVESNPAPIRRRTFSDDGFNHRESFSEEVSIYRAYAGSDDEDEVPAPTVSTSPPIEVDAPTPESLPSGVQPSLLEALGPVIHHPQPQHLIAPQPSPEIQGPSRTPSPPPPAATPSASTDVPAVIQTPPAFLSTIPPSPPVHHPRKEKDKKGIFGWGGDKSGKKNGKDKERGGTERTAEKESGFFGSLFGGGSKKKQDQEYPPPLGIQGGTSGRETAQALLGASKSKTHAPPLSPALSTGVGPNSYARYPIHVERAIYRLSHIKLANPRRPLYEQVLISNLMFWYLGVINKAQNPAPPPSGQATLGAQASPGTGGTQVNENEQTEWEKKENEQKEQRERERAEVERMERERLEKEQREMDIKKKESGRRGSLTKTPAPGSPGGGRRAEMPIKGPQYEMQHRVMEQEYSGYNGQPQQSPPMSRSTSSPVGNGNGQQYSRIQQQAQTLQSQNSQPKPAQPQVQKPDSFYYSADSAQNPQQQSRLPPGAMAPLDQTSWQQSALAPSRKITSPSPPPSSPVSHRSRSPPPNTSRHNPNASQDSLGSNRIPGRSLSATAIPSSPSSPQTNGRVRKGTSAHASLSPHTRQLQTAEGQLGSNGTGEEDMPLAMWQQQQRR